MVYQEYDDPALLRGIQLALTDALGEFDRVCRLLDIPYVAYGGTAIGAVRHAGFVPWDDDADVCMPRAEYERFLREAPSVLSDDFALENMRTHADFLAPYSYLGIKGTAFVPEFYRKCTYQRMLSLDIFPLDNMPDDPKLYRKQSRRTWLWGRLLILRATPAPHVELTGLLKAVVLSVSWVAHWSLRLFRFSPRFLQRKWEKAARQYEHDSTKMMADYSDQNPAAWAASRSELFPTSEVPFESISVPIPHDVDAILRRGYGDYMELPPEDNRKNHRPFHVALKS